jgi:hypothetical protein
MGTGAYNSIAGQNGEVERFEEEKMICRLDSIAGMVL